MKYSKEFKGEFSVRNAREEFHRLKRRGGKVVLYTKADGIKLVATFKEFWAMNRSEWFNFHFDEEIHRYLPSDYFKEDMSFDTLPNGLPLFRTIAVKGGRVIDLRINNDTKAIYAFDGAKNIGIADGTAFQVEPSYQKLGIATQMMLWFIKKNPFKPIGSVTPAGYSLLMAVHDELVINASLQKKKVPKEILLESFNARYNTPK